MCSAISGRAMAGPSSPAGVTFNAMRSPSRITISDTSRPDGVSFTRRLSCLTLRTRSPSNSITTSPVLTPAFSAGPAPRTFSTTTPCAEESFCVARSACSTSRIDTPIWLPRSGSTVILTCRSRFRSRASGESRSTRTRSWPLMDGARTMTAAPSATTPIEPTRMFRRFMRSPPRGRFRFHTIRRDGDGKSWQTAVAVPSRGQAVIGPGRQGVRVTAVYRRFSPRRDGTALDSRDGKVARNHPDASNKGRRWHRRIRSVGHRFRAAVLPNPPTAVT